MQRLKERLDMMYTHWLHETYWYLAKMRVRKQARGRKQSAMQLKLAEDKVWAVYRRRVHEKFLEDGRNLVD
jgi:hypothetical protein